MVSIKMKSASKELAKRRRQYARDIKEWLEGKRCHPHFDVYEEETGDMTMRWLEIAPPAVTSHHPKGRDGRLLLDPENRLACCHFCHMYIEDHSNWARARGYTI